MATKFPNLLLHYANRHPTFNGPSGEQLNRAKSRMTPTPRWRALEMSGTIDQLHSVSNKPKPKRELIFVLAHTNQLHRTLNMLMQ